MTNTNTILVLVVAAGVAVLVVLVVETLVPKGLVVYVDDDLHRRFAIMCTCEGLTLKDELYKMIKEDVECFEEYLKEGSNREAKN